MATVESRVYSQARVDPSASYRSKGVRAVLCPEGNSRSVPIKWGSGEEGGMEPQDTEISEEEPETGPVWCQCATGLGTCPLQTEADQYASTQGRIYRNKKKRSKSTM